MQKYFIAACILLGAATAARAQQPAAAPTSATSARSIFQPPVTLASCTPAADNTSRFLVTTRKPRPNWYRSLGTVWLRTGEHREERFQIAGRLIPSPNLAAQAGSIDPVWPAMAFAAGWQRIDVVPGIRASAIRLVSMPTPTTVDCAVR
jgi:hypothetical protein